jgi:hypothetical protein
MAESATSTRFLFTLSQLAQSPFSLFSYIKENKNGFPFKALLAFELIIGSLCIIKVVLFTK